ncbi:unnamed protein product [Cyclocybe aegerita]|uniref:Uncharacterized protein n=1 Tax=Cyclocybe aegerita TaxID=1973307 RepID=A0A8S0VRW0_CYCAE|nr:unnamed protein product [Cyclocybe aegerita]
MGADLAEFESHPFPYGTLTIRSNLLPQFVIFNAGQKLVKIPDINTLSTANAHIPNIFHKILSPITLYARWINVEPLTEWLNTPPPPARSSPSHSSQAPTEARRELKRPVNKQGSPTREWSEGNSGQGGSRANSERSTLEDFESIKKQDRRSEREMYNARMESVKSWRMAVAKELEAEPPDQCKGERGKDRVVFQQFDISSVRHVNVKENPPGIKYHETMTP